MIMPLEVFGEVRGTVFILKESLAIGRGSRGPVFELELRWWVESTWYIERVPLTAVVERCGGTVKSDMIRDRR